MKLLLLSLSFFICLQTFSQSKSVKTIEETNEFRNIEFKEQLSKELQEYYNNCFNDSLKTDCCIVWDLQNQQNPQKKLLCPCTNKHQGLFSKRDTVVYTHRKPDFIDFMEWVLCGKTK